MTDIISLSPDYIASAIHISKKIHKKEYTMGLNIMQDLKKKLNMDILMKKKNNKLWKIQKKKKTILTLY